MVLPSGETDGYLSHSGELVFCAIVMEANTSKALKVLKIFLIRVKLSFSNIEELLKKKATKVNYCSRNLTQTEVIMLKPSVLVILGANNYNFIVHTQVFKMHLLF